MAQHKIGPKEQDRINLRLMRYRTRGPGAIRGKDAERLSPETRARIVRGIEKHLTAPADDGGPKPSVALVQASAQPQESTMKKKSKKATKPQAKKRSRSDASRNLKAAKAKTKTTAKVKPKKAAAGGDAGENKTGQVVAMIQRAEGCTAAEVCAATGWKAVSIPPIAARAGVKLKKVAEGRGFRYFEDKAAA